MKRAAVIGMGKMGIIHASILNALPDVELVAVMDKDKKLKNWVHGIGIKATFCSSLDEMLVKEKADAVFICLPSFLNYPVAKECVARGLNVFVEKPLADNLENAGRMLELVRDKELKHAVGYMVAFVPTFEKAAAMLKDGVIGKVEHVEGKACLSGVFAKQKSWFYQREKTGGGAILAIGSHLLCLLQMLLSPVKTVRKAELGYVTGNEVEDEGKIELTLENHAEVALDISWSIQGYKNMWLMLCFHGEKGILRVTNQELELRVDKIEKLHLRELPNRAKLHLGGEGYCAEDEDFLQSLGTGREPRVTWRDGYRVQQVIAEIYEAGNAKWK